MTADITVTLPRWRRPIYFDSDSREVRLYWTDAKDAFRAYDALAAAHKQEIKTISEIKPGNYTVCVDSFGYDGKSAFINGYELPAAVLRSLPTPDPLADLKSAVVEAARMWREMLNRSKSNPTTEHLRDAVDALELVLKPYPAIELRDARAAWAMTPVGSDEAMTTARRLDSAIEAAIAAMGGGKP